jgi:hypothetical protein
MSGTSFFVDYISLTTLPGPQGGFPKRPTPPALSKPAIDSRQSTAIIFANEKHWFAMHSLQQVSDLLVLSAGLLTAFL